MNGRSVFAKVAIFLVVLLTLPISFPFSREVSSTFAASGGLALTPPMGWNSWNKSGCHVNESLVKQEADAMINSGMQAVGYQYINIDDCWMASYRDRHGNLVADSTHFPTGIKALADYVHSKGLKLGIYNDVGAATCQGLPGMFSFEQQDADTYASWNIDYLKVDWCNTGGLDPQMQYTKIHSALIKTGRPIVLSLCDWGGSDPWIWGPAISNLWRTTGDIRDSWSSMLHNLDSNASHAASAGPGGWNDPDMLEVGNGGMSTIEYRAHFSMWAMSAAPLIAGNDLANMSSDINTILTNREVIAVDQDPAGIQGTDVVNTGSGLQVWARKLQGDSVVAVALFNRSAVDANITARWRDIGLAVGSASVRDLWAHADMGAFTDSYTTTVSSHAVVMLKIISNASHEGAGSSNTTPTPLSKPSPISVPTPVAKSSPISVPTLVAKPSPISVPTLVAKPSPTSIPLLPTHTI